MRVSIRLMPLMLLVVGLSGCTLVKLIPVPIKVSDPDVYLDPKETEELVIPEDMDHREIQDGWVVPKINERPLSRVFPRSAPRPAAIVGDADPDLIRIQNLGAERSWMVVQRTPATVWPVVKQWVQDNGMSVNIEEPSFGLLISNPVDLEGEDPLGLGKLIANEKQEAGIEGGVDWFAFRLENGVRRGSSEVHLRYLNSATLPNSFDWPERSTSVEIERSVLNVLVNYDAAGYVAPTVSSVAGSIALQPKAEILNDDQGYPYMRLNVDFARAWATIQKAIDNAELDLVDGNSEERVFEIQVSTEMLTGKRPGIFSRVLRLDQRKNAKKNIVQIRILDAPSGFDIVLDRSGDVEISIEFAQQMLAVLREFAV